MVGRLAAQHATRPIRFVAWLSLVYARLAETAMRKNLLPFVPNLVIDDSKGISRFPGCSGWLSLSCSPSGPWRSNLR